MARYPTRREPQHLREAAMKAVAFANNDMAVMAWTFGGKLPNCLGFAIYRVDVRAGTETCLPAMATFPDQDASKPGRTTADDPIQKFYWKDVYAKRGGTYHYKIVPMTGEPGALRPMTYGPAISNQIQLSPHYGTLSAYFNRGILATQATAKALNDDKTSGSMADKLDRHIAVAGDPLRVDQVASAWFQTQRSAQGTAFEEGLEGSREDFAPSMQRRQLLRSFNQATKKLGDGPKRLGGGN